MKAEATCDLVNELKSREGVRTIQISPYESVEVTLKNAGVLDETGPAIVLYVID